MAVHCRTAYYSLVDLAQSCAKFLSFDGSLGESAPVKGRVSCKKLKKLKFIFGFHWECRARGIFIIILGHRFAGEKRCPKRHTATPTMRLPVAVKCGRGVT